jgi:hypothetical protein
LATHPHDALVGAKCEAEPTSEAMPVDRRYRDHWERQQTGEQPGQAKRGERSVTRVRGPSGKLVARETGAYL